MGFEYDIPTENVSKAEVVIFFTAQLQTFEGNFALNMHFSIKEAPNEWNETEITYNNQPSSNGYPSVSPFGMPH